MHDPQVVAFTIVRPWPQRSAWRDKENGDRWRIRMHHVHHEPYCTENKCTGNPFPWWRPRSYSRFWLLAGREYYWPALITVWHNEPGGHDSGEVCKHYHRWQDEAGKWHGKSLRAWRFHVWHWSLQFHPYQNARRWLLTRCEWCHGRSVKGDRVNHSEGWDSQKSPWWRGERGLFHGDCISVKHAHQLCMCPDPLLDHDGYGTCAHCGKHRSWRQEPGDADRLLAALPAGSRITADVRPAVEAAWAENRARKEAAE